MKNIPNEPGFWKFNSSLLNNETFKINSKDFVKNTKSKLTFDDIQAIAKEQRARWLKLENMLKMLDNNLTDNVKT